ncbi:MAG: carbohydrate binding domain-containing protein [Spirochaetales bacterium]|nr:carbohydrate binding domain-containing protein [Spirochaetales bacterium]
MMYLSEGQLYFVGGVADNRQRGQGDCCSPGIAVPTLILLTAQKKRIKLFLKIEREQTFMKVIIALIGISTIILTPLFSENLLKNPGMEESDTQPLHWTLDQFNKGGSVVKIEKGIAHSGNNSISINNIEQNDARLMQDVTIKENTIYKISGWIKTENVSYEGIGANLSFNEHWFTSEEIEGTQDDWRYVDFYLSVKYDITRLSFCLRVGGYGGISTGKAYFDDVAMEEVKSIPPDSREFSVGSGKGENKKNNTNTTANTNTKNDPVVEQTVPRDPQTMGSMILVYSLLGLAVIVFILQLILVKPEK